MITSILAALIFIPTVFINIRLPIGKGGLIHLGTAMLFITPILFGPKKGTLAGAIGMGLFDFLGGWLIWAPTTIISRALQGLIVGKTAWSKGHRRTTETRHLAVLLTAWMACFCFPKIQSAEGPR